MQSINDSTPQAKDNLLLTCSHNNISSKPKTKIKQLKVIGTNDIVNFVNTYNNKCNLSDKLDKSKTEICKNNDSCLLSSDKTTMNDCSSSLCNKLPRKDVTRFNKKGTSFDKKENLYSGNKNTWNKTITEFKKGVLTLDNKLCKELSAKRCLFTDTIHSTRDENKLIEAKIADFEPNIVTRAQECEIQNLTLACSNSQLLSKSKKNNAFSCALKLKERKRNYKQLLRKNNSRAILCNSNYSTNSPGENFIKHNEKWLLSKQHYVLPPEKKEKHSKNLSSMNKETLNVNKSKENLSSVKVDQLLRQSCNVESIIKSDKHINASKTYYPTENYLPNRNLSEKYQQSNITTILDSNLESYKISFKRTGKNENKCLKLGANSKVKTTKRCFEPISDDEHDEYVIEQFLSQTDKDANILSNTPKIDIKIADRNNSTNKMKLPHTFSNTKTRADKSSFRIRTELNDHLIVQNMASRKIIQGEMVNSNNNNNSKEATCINKINSSTEMFSPQTNLKLKCSDFRKELIVESERGYAVDMIVRSANNNKIHSVFSKHTENKSQGSKETLHLLSNGNRAYPTSPVLSWKRPHNENWNETLDLFSNVDIRSCTSPILSGKRPQNHKLNSTLDMSNNADIISCTSPILSGKRQNHTLNGTLDMFSNADFISCTSPILSEKRQNHKLNSTLDMSNNADFISCTSPILLGKRQNHKLNGTSDTSSNADFISCTSPILLGKRQNHKLNGTLDLFSNKDYIDFTSPTLPEKQCADQSLYELSDFSNTEKLYAVSISPLLSEKRPQNRNLNETDLLSNDDQIHSPSILSRKKVHKLKSNKVLNVSSNNDVIAQATESDLIKNKTQNQRFKETLDIFDENKSDSQRFKESLDLFDEISSTSSIQSGKRSHTQIINHKLRILTKNDALHEVSDIFSGNAKENVINLVPTECENTTDNCFRNRNQSLPIKESLDFVKEKRRCLNENDITDALVHCKSKKPDKNDQLFIEEFPTQITLIERPDKVLKKSKLENRSYNTDVNFSDVKSVITIGDLDNGDSMLNSRNTAMFYNQFYSGTNNSKLNSHNFLTKDINFDFNCKSKVINRTLNQSQEVIIEDFTSQEKSDNISVGDIIETQSSPKSGSSSTSQVSDNQLLTPAVKFTSHALSEQTNILPLDSPEKKRNHKPKLGSLTQRMKRLLRFQSSMFCMWKHNGELNGTHNSTTLRVNKIWNEFGKIIIDCYQNTPSLDKKEDTTGKTRLNVSILAIVDPTAAGDVSENCIISIHPPWHSVIFEEIDLVVILNVTKLQVITRFVHMAQPQTDKTESKMFACSCIQNSDGEADGSTDCNFRLPHRGAELISPLYQINRLHNPKFFQTGERTVAAAYTNSFLTNDLTLELSICHQFRCINETGRNSLNALAIDKNGDCCQIALKTSMEAETNSIAEGNQRNNDRNSEVGIISTTLKDSAR